MLPNKNNKTLKQAPMKSVPSLSAQNSLKDKDAESFHTWINHAEISDLEDERMFVVGLKGNSRYWEVLNKIIKGMYEAKCKSNFDFNTPNWLEKECFNKGYLKALEDVYKLIPKTNEDK